MAKRTDIPQFGPLQGVRVLHASISIAGPFTAELMAEWGADVIWIENPKGPDISRFGTGGAVELDRRNMREISINVASPEGKEFFLRQLKETDIFIEASKPGQYAKWGLTDEAMWAVNPRLVIVHISGFGQHCHEDYFGRASYDPVAQAVGGMMYINSLPGAPASPVLPTIADYYTAFYACSASLAAYTNVLKGGKGESIDVAQYETVLRTSTTWGMNEWNNATPFDRVNNHNGNDGTAGFGAYRCKDGNEIYVLVLGPGVFKATCEFFGLAYGSDTFPEGTPFVKEQQPAGKILNETLTQYFAERDSSVAEAELSARGIPCACILQYGQMPTHPLFLSRNTIIDYEKLNGQHIKGPGVVPSFKNQPGQVWRGAPSIGCDNEDILADLGYSPEEVAALYEKGVMNKIPAKE